MSRDPITVTVDPDDLTAVLYLADDRLDEHADPATAAAILRVTEAALLAGALVGAASRRAQQLIAHHGRPDSAGHPLTRYLGPAAAYRPGDEVTYRPSRHPTPIRRWLHRAGLIGPPAPQRLRAVGLTDHHPALRD